jgi:hypothetical protein
MSSRTTFNLASPATLTPAQEAPAESTRAGGTDHRATLDARPSKALTLRRGFLVAAPLLAGVLATVGAVADPAAGIAGDEMVQIYADNMDRLQYKSLAYHWSYAFWILPAMLILPMVRGRGAWLATITGFIGFLGVSTMPGLLMSDFFDSAIAAAHGLQGHRAVYDALEGVWGVPAFVAPGILGFVLALPLAMITLWRAGLARWWGLAAAVAAMAAFTVSNATWPGAAIATLFLGVVSLAFARATHPARRTT